MTAISQTPIQPGSFNYGRSTFLIWDVKPIEDGYEYQYVEVPIAADESAISNALLHEGIEGQKAQEIIVGSKDKAIVGVEKPVAKEINK